MRLTNEDLKNGKLAVAKGKMGKDDVATGIEISYCTRLFNCLIHTVGVRGGGTFKIRNIN